MKVSDNHKLYFNGKLYKPVQYAKLPNNLCFGKAQQITENCQLLYSNALTSDKVRKKG